MKIERITLTHVRIPLVEPFKISNGEVKEKDGIVVGLSSEGMIGWGESSPMSGGFYSDDTPESVWDDLVGKLIPATIGKKPGSIEELNALLDATEASPFAKAGLETAFWDLKAQQQREPLFRTLGGKKGSVESGLAVGIYPTIGKLIAAIERYLKEGYKRVKIKVQPGWDIEPLLAVRGEFGKIALMVDANCAYTRSDLSHLHAFDDFDLMMIEQPLPKEDLEGHAQLQASIRTPVCIDESARDPATVQQAIAMKSCRIVNIKIQRVGGLHKAKEIHDLCAGAGIPVWGGTMPELGIGGAQTLHLATLPNVLYPTDVESSARWFVDDIIEPLIEVRDGVITIPPGTGNCYTVSEAKLRNYEVRKQSFS